MMFADAENFEAGFVGEFDFFQKVLHALDGAEDEARGWV
jgi:hypothetical protein